MKNCDVVRDLILPENWMEQIEFDVSKVPEFNVPLEKIILSLNSKLVFNVLVSTCSNFFKSQLLKLLVSEYSEQHDFLFFKVDASTDLTDDNFFEFIKEELSNQGYCDENFKVVLYIDNISERLTDYSFKNFIDNLMDVKDELGLKEMKLLATIDSCSEAENAVYDELVPYVEKRYVVKIIEVDEPEILDFSKIFSRQIFGLFNSNVSISKKVYEYFLCNVQIMNNKENSYSAISFFLMDVEKICTFCKVYDISKVTRKVIDAFYRYERDESYKDNIKDGLHLVTIHEAGHALVEYVLGGDFLFVTNFSDHEECDGAINYSPKCRGNDSLKDILNDATVDMGSMAAEILCGYTPDFGLKVDFSMAKSNIEEGIMALGTDPEFGIYYSEKKKMLTNKKKKILEERTEKYLEKCLKKAIKIIKNNRQFFNAIVKQLKKKRILTLKDIQKIEKKIKKKA